MWGGGWGVKPGGAGFSPAGFSARPLANKCSLGLAFHGDAHAAGRPFNNPDGMILIAGVEVVDLSLGDFADLGGTDGEALVLAAFLGLFFFVDDLAAFFLFQGDARRLFEEHRGGRTFHFKGEAAVVVNGDDYRQGDAALVLAFFAKLRDKGADIDAVLAQSGTDGRSRGRLASRHLQPYQGGHLLGHEFSTTKLVPLAA